MYFTFTIIIIIKLLSYDYVNAQIMLRSCHTVSRVCTVLTTSEVGSRKTFPSVTASGLGAGGYLFPVGLFLLCAGFGL